jgi:hypothetical protein
VPQSKKVNQSHQLPSMPTIDNVQSRLEAVLPSGVTGLPILTGSITARVVWTSLYCGAIAHVRHVRPTMICWMRDSIASDTSVETRNLYWETSSQNQRAFEQAFPGVIGEASWYRDNTREVIRDDVLRGGLWSVGAVLRDESRPTNSSKPVWTLEPGFAALFDPSLRGTNLDQRVKKWQDENLTEVLHGRLRATQAAHTSQHEVEVSLPDGGVRRLGAGLSSLIAKGVVEDLAQRALVKPQVVSLSEGREHVSPEDQVLLTRLGLEMTSDRLLPDIVLFDSSSKTLWCIEVVATDGPINEMRKTSLIEWANAAGFIEEKMRFVTAFESRTSQIFRTRIATIARNTDVWFLDEPKLLMRLESF